MQALESSQNLDGGEQVGKWFGSQKAGNKVTLGGDFASGRLRPCRPPPNGCVSFPLCGDGEQAEAHLTSCSCRRTLRAPKREARKRGPPIKERPDIVFQWK